MFRSSLFLLLSLPLIQGFGVARPAFCQPSTVLFAADMDPSFSDESEFSADKEEPTLSKEPYFIGDDKGPAVVTTSTSTKDELSAKAQAAISDISAKAQDLVNDPKIKEISGKATEFTKDFVGNMLSQVGNKLKEMKKEKEAMKK
jgi:hypothetical protein